MKLKPPVARAFQFAAVAGEFVRHFVRLGLKPWQIEGDADGEGTNIIKHLRLMGWPIGSAHNGGKPRRLKNCLLIRILRQRQTSANARAYRDLWSIFGLHMAGTVKHAKLESRTARSRLKRGRQPHWQALVPGRVHLGYQCWKGDPAGRWVLRR